MSTPEGPSVLTEAPVTLPAEGRGTLVVPLSASPYRSPGEVRSAPQARPVAAIDPPLPVARAYVPAFGDAAGEHLMMIRGRYSAWTHVVLAFLFEAALLGALPMLGLSLVLHDAGLVIGAAIGAVLAWFVFRDRWRCIEAFSSRWCSGLMNLSMLYVPAVALIYANVRGIQKRSGR